MAPRDVAVVGLGAMGATALAHLTRRGLNVVGIERLTPGHAVGSSHGRTRIIRLGYFEHPSYVPLVRASLSLWRELERETGTRLLTVTGIVEIGAPDSALIAGTREAARLHGLPHQVLDATELRRRFPAFVVPAHFVGVIQGDGGILAAESAIAAHLRLAVAAGAELRTSERVLAVEPAGDSVRIVTDRGAFSAGQAIVAAGSWLKTLLPTLPARLTVTRQAVGWFSPRDPAAFAREPFPVFLLENEDGVFYGFPPHDGAGVKFAKHHHQNEAIDPDAPTRPFDGDDEKILRAALATHLPAANGALAESATCRYTMTQDGDFVLDRLPGAPQVIVASPCSGHGFKFAPVIGEILADLATTGHTRHDIARFSFARFG